MSLCAYVPPSYLPLFEIIPIAFVFSIHFRDLCHCLPSFLFLNVSNLTRLLSLFNQFKPLEFDGIYFVNFLLSLLRIYWQSLFKAGAGAVPTCPCVQLPEFLTYRL